MKKLLLKISAAFFTFSFSKVLSGKKIVYRITKLRVFVFAFVLGVFGFWGWQLQFQTKPAPVPARFLVQIPPSPDDNTEALIENRNLADYGQIRVSDCNMSPSKEYSQCENDFEKGRELILNRWKEKKRTLLIHEWTGADCGGEIYYFVEPDENGNWHILIRQMGRAYKIDSEEAIFIKRKRINKDDSPRIPGKFYLGFVDKNGRQKGFL